MSWLFSQALVEEFSEANSWDGEPCAQLSVMQTRHQFSRKGKTMDALSLSRFGLEWSPLTEGHGMALLKSFLAAFPVQTYPLPGREQESKEGNPASGQKCSGLFARYSHTTYSWKTVQLSLVEDSDEFSGIWPQWGVMRDGECWEPPMSERHTPGFVGGALLPTPSGVNAGRNHVVGRLDEWGGSSNPWRGTEIGKVRSPSFEEWMMGWPVGWTDAQTVLGTDKYQQWLQWHGSC